MTVATNIFTNISGNLIPTNSTGSHALQLVLLCGISAGSTVVPIAVSGNGAILTF